MRLLHFKHTRSVLSPTIWSAAIKLCYVYLFSSYTVCSSMGFSSHIFVLVTLPTRYFKMICVRACLMGGQQLSAASWPSMSILRSLQHNVIEYSSYAPVADWRYAGIQLLFISPQLGRLIYLDRISLHDLSVPTLHQCARSWLFEQTICSTENR